MRFFVHISIGRSGGGISGIVRMSDDEKDWAGRSQFGKGFRPTELVFDVLFNLEH